MKRILPLAILAALLLAGLAVFAIPPVRARVTSHLAAWRADLYYAINPPEKEVFVPEPAVAQAVQGTLAALATPSPTVTLTATLPAETATPQPSPTPTLVPTALPESIRLTGAKHEYQGWNNCGPATLSVNLSFWGWQGDQRDTAGWIKPNDRDKNTSAYELLDYVRAETDLRALLRVGGDLETLKRLIAAGFPVIIERGFDGYDDEGWMGHYELITGYDDSYQKVITQDVLIMPDFPLPYTELTEYWRAFNYVFVVVYPPEREADLMQALGPLADETQAYQIALDRAKDEINTLTGREQFFAWFNAGESLLHFEDFAGAADAFDQAFGLYAQLEEKNRPWRMVWYQHGPYPAYYALGRYQDVINLATHTLSRSSEPALEESFFWRGRAYQFAGDQAKGVEDLRAALKWHPNWQPALDELALWGETP
ncbi:MAG TPA: C39 family peptidase [Anaerolineaceae bacterium]|nr:C39 family peptidase [Anaerolineaceae bacterium]